MKYIIAFLALLFVVVSPGTASAASLSSWQYQLDGTIDVSVNAAWFDIDGFDNTSATVAAIHSKGAKAICYLDAGTWENWRPDASKFPASVKGSSNGWPGEKWLDIRQVSVLLPIMSARADMCKQKGFDAIEWDNVDGYSNSSGFPLTANDQLTYNRALAQIAHSRNMPVALKNDLDQSSALQPSFDMAILEQCVQYRECGMVKPFISAGKPVLDVEYSRSCSIYAGISIIRKRLALDAWRQVC